MNSLLGAYRTQTVRDRGAGFKDRASRELSYPAQDFYVGDRLECIIIRVSDTVGGCESSWHSEMSVSDSMAIADIQTIRYADTSESVERFFPEYFYAQEPYRDLIDTLSERAGFCYASADMIYDVYDIDRLPDDRRYYNALLRLIGINYDFSTYPTRMLRFLIQNYLSIRKHRGTRASLLAMLRCMDEKFIEDPSNRCELEIDNIELPVANGKTVNRQGTVEIYYENLPSEYAGHVRYMLGKVMPTGLYYRLAHRRIKVSDSIAVFDRGFMQDTHIRTRFLKEEMEAQDKLPVREYQTSEGIRISGNIRNTFGDEAYFGEHARIVLYLSDGMADMSEALNQERRVQDSMTLEIAGIKEEHEGRILHYQDEMAVSEPSVGSVQEWHSGIDTSRPSVINWPYTVKTLSDEIMYFDENESHGLVFRLRETMFIQQGYSIRDDIVFHRTSDSILLEETRRTYEPETGDGEINGEQP